MPSNLNTLLVWCFLLTVVLHRLGKWPRVKGRKSQFVEETRGWWTAQLWCKDDDKTRHPIDIHPIVCHWWTDPITSGGHPRTIAMSRCPFPRQYLSRHLVNHPAQAGCRRQTLGTLPAEAQSTSRRLRMGSLRKKTINFPGKPFTPTRLYLSLVKPFRLTDTNAGCCPLLLIMYYAKRRRAKIPCYLRINWKRWTMNANGDQTTATNYIRTSILLSWSWSNSVTIDFKLLLLSLSSSSSSVLRYSYIRLKKIVC